MSRPSESSCRYTSSAVRWRILDVSNRLMMRSRGSVAFSPAVFRSCAVLIAVYNSRSFRLARFPPTVTRFAPLAALAAAALLAGCQSWSNYLPDVRNFGIYKLDVNQVNYNTQDMVDKLKVGQTKQQVRLALGTPLLTSAFHDNRWDYIYEYTRQGRKVEHR